MKIGIYCRVSGENQRENTSLENQRLNGIKFCEVNITNSGEAKRKLKENGFKTVPQIFDEERLIGGYTELKESLS